MKPTDVVPMKTETLQGLTAIARTIVQQELVCEGEVVSRRAYWHLAEMMRIYADFIEAEVGKRSDYAKERDSKP